MFWLLVIFRWMHILGTIALVGSALFYWQVLLAGNVFGSGDNANKAWQSLRGRWARLVMLSILLLLVSGTANTFLMVKSGEFKQVPAGVYHGLLALKIGLAIVVFLLMSFLTGKTAVAQRLQKNMQLWISISVILAVLVVMLAGIMKSTSCTSSNHDKSEPVLSLRHEPTRLLSPCETAMIFPFQTVGCAPQTATFS
ncbi:MAG: hypothetical protein CMJ81_14840 [Planctomycetaceae bacterium]|nr:hypothetical protein [Planctomycetaceae bacterium]MBP63880.1 hypothetical protein [Planctomycetaceae bacterium]